jgi:hypothetical protein
LIAIHFEAQKGKFSNLVFSKITAKSLQKHGFSPIMTKQPKCPWSYYIWQLY